MHNELESWGNVLMYFGYRKCVDETRSNSSGMDEAIVLSWSSRSMLLRVFYGVCYPKI